MGYMIISYTRRICEYPNCKRVTRNKGYYKGKIRYDRFCGWHHKRSGKQPSPYFLKNSLPNKQCEVCGWKKAFCDRHRIKPEIGYTKENIMILCPNCHRLEGLGLLKFSKNSSHGG